MCFAAETPPNYLLTALSTKKKCSPPCRLHSPGSAGRRHRSPDERRPLGAASPAAPDHPGAGLQPAAGALRRLRGRRGGAEGREQPGGEVRWVVRERLIIITIDWNLSPTSRARLPGGRQASRQGRTTQWELITAPHAPRPVLYCNTAASPAGMLRLMCPGRGQNRRLNALQTQFFGMQKVVNSRQRPLSQDP